MSMLSLTHYLQNTFATRPVVIFGFGREGRSTLAFLQTHLPEAKITVVDDDPAQATPDTQVLPSAQATITPDTVLFKTPGIPPSHPFLAQATQLGCMITSNTQLLFELLLLLPTQPLTIGVTGTKGKSTTTSMIYHVLAKAGLPAWLAGNIGVPPLSLWEELSAWSAPAGNGTTTRSATSGSSAPTVSTLPPTTTLPIIVLELSAFQLSDLTHSPNIAVLLEITPEHLDYYSDFDTYTAAKARLGQFQTSSDLIIFNPNYPATAQAAATSPGKHITFGAGQPWHLTETALAHGRDVILERSSIPLAGEHNALNTIPACIIANHLGLSSEQIQAAVRSFRSLPHRLEFVAEINGVMYYNDSLATAPPAAIAALETFAQHPVVLIAGGTDRNLDLHSLAQAIANHSVHTLILFPPTGEIIAKFVHELKPDLKIEHVTSMQQAVMSAHSAARPGDKVLMSPGCASFGIFKNYADRGEQFIQAVRALTAG